MSIFRDKYVADCFSSQRESQAFRPKSQIQLQKIKNGTAIGRSLSFYCEVCKEKFHVKKMSESNNVCIYCKEKQGE